MLKKDILNMPSVAYYSGLDGVELKSIEYGTEDYALCVSGCWCGQKKPHRLKIYYSADNAYIMLHGYKCPLDEFIKM